MRTSRSIACSPEQGIINTPDVHGFVISGIQTIFLHHLAMFHMENHRYQVILEASLPSYAMPVYVSARLAKPRSAFVLGNVPDDQFTLPDLQTRTRTSFIADIFDGTPKDDSVPLVHNVRVQVRRVVYFRHFDDQMAYMPHLSYLLFGAGTEAHLAHVLTKADDFDNVLDLEAAPDWLPVQQLAAGVQLDFPSLPFQPPYNSSPLTEGSYTVWFQGLPIDFKIAIGPNYWFDNVLINLGQ